MLQSLEDLSHSDRMGKLVKLGKESITNTKTKKLIEDLAQEGTYERLLALETCYGSQDANLALRILSSPSKHLKKRCISMLGLFGTDNELLQGLKLLPPRLQFLSIQRLTNLKPKRRRLAVIDRFVEGEGPEGDSTENDQFQKFLAYGTKELIEKYLPTTVESFSTRDWSRFASYHPEIALRELKSWRKRISGPFEEPFHSILKQTITQWSSSGWTVDLALNLLDVVLPDAALTYYPTQNLMRRRPRQTADILLKQEDDDVTKFVHSIIFDNKQIRGLIDCLSPDELWRIIKLYPSLVTDYDYFRLFPPSFRALLYQKHLKERMRNEDGEFDIDILRLLPAKERTIEARRHTTLATFKIKPSDHIGHISMLPWNEAMRFQQGYLSSANVDVRVDALKWQIGAVKYDNSYLGDALQIIIKHEHEREPVRRYMIQALEDVPASRFKKDHLPALETIVTHCLNAEDTTQWSFRSFSTFITKLLSHHPDWAAEQYVRLYKARPSDAIVCNIVGTVSERKATMFVVSEKLSPHIETRLVKYSVVTKIANLAEHFQDNIRFWPSFLDTMEEICERDFLQDQFHHILKKERPNFWSTYMAGIFKRDAFVEEIREPVLEYVALHAQQHLKIYFEGYDAVPPINIYDREQLLCRFEEGFWRWTKAQQDTYAEILQKDINDPEAPTEDKLKAMKRLRKLPFIDTRILIHYARSEESLILRTEALRALGNLDTDEGVPTLLEALKDERGQIAIFSLNKNIKAMSKPDAFRMLKAVPSTKVTVAKEVVRLVGDLKTEESFQHLLALENSAVHVDVRIAIFPALSNYLERDETWAVYTRAAKSDVVEVAKWVVNIPIANQPPEIREKIIRLLYILLQHSAMEIRIASLARLRTPPYIPISDPDILAPRIQELIFSPTRKESERAIDTILTRYSIPKPELVSSIFRQLLSDKKMLKMMFDKYMILLDLDSDPHARLACTQALLKVLSDDDLTISLRVELIFTGLPIPSHPDAIIPLLQTLHHDALSLALNQIEALCYKAETPKLRQELLDCELKFKETRDARGAKLSLAYLIGVATGTNQYQQDILGFEKPWNSEQRARLEIYRKHDSLGVREVAAWVFPPELVEG